MTYDPHEMRIIRRGVSITKLIAAYKHFGSLRRAAQTCGVSKDTVRNVLRRYNVELPKAELPKNASYTRYGPKRLYSSFAKWHKAHANDPDLPRSRKELAAKAHVGVNIVKCYFYRRRAAARKLLDALPDLRKLALTLEDIEGNAVPTKSLTTYRYAIDRYSAQAAIQGTLGETAVTILIPSIEVFAARVRKASA